jgi:hypothetical protein
LFGSGALMDIPNLILMFPVGLYILSLHFSFENIKKQTKLLYKPVSLWLIIGFIPLVALFAFYNYQTTNSFTKIAQNLGRSETASSTIKMQNKEITPPPTNETGKALINIPFQTRNMLNGLYILLLSNQRSWLFYSPILLLGVVGLYFAYKNKKTQTLSILAISVIGTNIVLYSMFGDPWGGWAYGPRYLIPSAALISAFIGITVTKLGKNKVFMLIFSALLLFSVFVSTLSAVTSNAIPPKVEAINFNPPLPYTYKYDFRYLDKNQASTLLYNIFLRDKLSLWNFQYLVTGIIYLSGMGLFILILRQRKTHAN